MHYDTSCTQAYQPTADKGQLTAAPMPLNSLPMDFKTSSHPLSLADVDISNNPSSLPQDCRKEHDPILTSTALQEPFASHQLEINIVQTMSELNKSTDEHPPSLPTTQLLLCDCCCCRDGVSFCSFNCVACQIMDVVNWCWLPRCCKHIIASLHIA